MLFLLAPMDPNQAGDRLEVTRGGLRRQNRLAKRSVGREIDAKPASW